MSSMLRLCGALLLAIAVASPAAAFTLDWSAIGWDDADASGSQSFLNVDGSGVDVTVDYTNNMWDGPPNVYGPDPDFPLPADVLGSLRFTNDRDTLLATTVTVNFSEAVDISEAGLVGLSIIWDRWQEHGIIEPFDAQGASVFASSYTTSDPTEVMLDTDGDASYDTIGTKFQDDGFYGDAMVSFEGITSISFSMFVSDIDGDSPVLGFGSVGIKDVEFSAVPEPGTLLLMTSGVAGLALLGRRRR